MNAKDFITRQLATVGWAPIHPEIVKMLCPDCHDAWSLNAWLSTPGSLPRSFPGTSLYRAKVPGLGDVLVLSRSEMFLVERMDWLGLPATSVEEIAPAANPYATRKPEPEAIQKPRPDLRIERIRRLAAEDPPAHECEHRRAILAAREELAQIEAQAA